jgi:hypothetical protein
MDFNELDTKVKNSIAAGELGEAIKTALEFFRYDERAYELIGLSRRYHAVEAERRKGGIDYEEAQKTGNQLTTDLLGILRLEREERTLLTTDNQNNESKPSAFSQLPLSMASICILLVLNKIENQATGLSISQIYRLTKVKSRKNVYITLQEMVKEQVIEKTKIGTTIHWKLAEKGKQMAAEVEMALLAVMNAA